MQLVRLRLQHLHKLIKNIKRKNTPEAHSLFLTFCRVKKHCCICYRKGTLPTCSGQSDLNTCDVLITTSQLNPIQTSQEDFNALYNLLATLVN